MSDKLMDKLLDEVIKEGVKLAVEDWDRELPEPEPYEFSKEHELKMRKFFRKERNKLRMQSAIKMAPKVAAVILAVVVVSAAIIYRVDAFRVRFMNFVIEMNQTHSKINFNDDEKGDSYSSDEISLEYIPKGFKLETGDAQDNKVNLKFVNGEFYFKFDFRTYEPDGSSEIDTEFANIEKLTVNGCKAAYSSNNNVNILLWYDENFTYRLLGNIERDEMIKIGENIKR